MRMEDAVQRQLELRLERADRATRPDLPPENRSELLRALAEMFVAIATVRQTAGARRTVDEVAKVDR